MAKQKKQIEICLVVHRRYYRLPKILKDLSRQTFQNFNLNIWNNSNRKLDVFLKDCGFPKKRIKVHNSKENVGSQARFRLVPLTKGNPIIFIDDDEEFKERMVEYFYKEWKTRGKDHILGWYTRTFNAERYHPCIDKPPYGSEVDYIGTGGMILDREIFEKEPILQNIPEPFDKTEDLFLCYLARMKHNMKLVKIHSPINILIDGKDQYVKIDKQAIFKKLRKKGWWILKDNFLKMQAYNNLKEVKEVFDELEIPFWVQEGLLLGLHREGDIIKGDEDDTDICVWKEHSKRMPEVFERLKERGFHILGDWKFVDGTTEGACVGRNGNKVDIIMMHKNKDKAYWLARNFARIGNKNYFAAVFSADIYDKFTTIKWHDIEYRCPAKIEKYLEERYGKDWKTPKLRGEAYDGYSLKDNPCFDENFKYEEISSST